MEKVIHCIWLGGPKTKLARRCRASWSRFAPEWRIREWGGGDLRAAGPLPPYAEDALAAQKWAFASDWFRFWILFREGGVYLDYDVELVAPLARLGDGEWVAAEWMKHGEWGYNPGSGIALEPNAEIARKMLDYYGTASYDTAKTVGDIMRDILGDPVRTDAIRVLPPEVMSPTDWHGKVRRTDATIAVHHYALSWIGWKRRIARWMSWHGMDWIVQGALWVRRMARASERGRRD